MKSLYRMGLLVVAVLVLVACGGSPAEVPSALAPSDAMNVDNADFVKIRDGWQSQVKAGLELGMIKPETIVVDEYMSDSDLAAVTDYYNKQLGTLGWTYRKRSPGDQDGFYIGGYEHGTTSLVVGALDLQPFGGKGTYVYVAYGNK
jgi:hypothetical protein